MKGHFVLLGLGAVVFDGQDEGEVGNVECVRTNGVLQHLFEINLGGKSPSVVYDGLVAVAVPTVCREVGLRAINSTKELARHSTALPFARYDYDYERKDAASIFRWLKLIVQLALRKLS